MRDEVDNVLAVSECKRACIHYEHIIIKLNTGWDPIMLTAHLIFT